MTSVCTLLLFCSLQPTTEGPALDGLDPVALCAGEEVAGVAAHEASWGLHGYRFASAASLARFREDPERYAIQWDGACGSMGPLSGKGDPARWAVEDGRLFVFASDACRERFLAEPERFLAAPPTFPEANAEDLVAGRTWLDRAVAGHGGAPVIDAPRALVLRQHGTQSGWRFERSVLFTVGGDVKRSTTWTPPEGEGEPSTWAWSVTADDRGLQLGEHQHAVTSPHAIADVRRYAHREPLFHLWARDAPAYAALHVGAGTLGERATEDVLVSYQGLLTTLHLDPTSARVLGLSWFGRLNDGASRAVVETFDDWTVVAGVALPRARAVTLDGQRSESLSTSWDELEGAAALPAETFRRP